MTEKETFTEKTLKRIKSGERTPSSARSRRLSKIVLIIDAVFVILILMFFFGKEKKDIYQTSTVSYNKLQVRFSIDIDRNTDDYLFSLSIKSNEDEKKSYNFSNSLATLDILYKNEIIKRNIIGKNIKRAELLPGEIKTFVSKVNRDTINEIALERGLRPTSRVKSLLQPGKNSIPLTALLSLNVNGKISSSIDFNHEVSK